jgi:hypothetical protein
MDREPAFSAYVAARRAGLSVPRACCADIVQDTLARLYAN